MRPESLERTLASLSLQSFREFEVHVYDNASEDRTERIVRSFAREHPGFHYHRRPSNIGAFDNFDLGIRAVTTEFFSVLSDDDLVLPTFFESTVRAMDIDPLVMLAATTVLNGDRAGGIWREPMPPAGAYQVPDGLVALIEYGHPNWGGVLFRTQVLRRGFTLDRRTDPLFDWDFELRIAARHPLVVLEDLGAIYFPDKENRVLDWVRPWSAVVDRLRLDSDLPLALRIRAERTLWRRLRRHLLDRGMRAAWALEPADVARAIHALRAAPDHSPTLLALRMSAFLARLPRVGRIALGVSEIRSRNRRLQEQADIDRAVRELPPILLGYLSESG